MYQPLIKFHPHPAIFTQVLAIFEINLQDTCARCEKYSSKLDISRSLIRIFVGNLSIRLKDGKEVFYDPRSRVLGNAWRTCG